MEATVSYLLMLKKCFNLKQDSEGNISKHFTINNTKKK